MKTLHWHNLTQINPVAIMNMESGEINVVLEAHAVRPEPRMDETILIRSGECKLVLPNGKKVKVTVGSDCHLKAESMKDRSDAWDEVLQTFNNVGRAWIRKLKERVTVGGGVKLSSSRLNVAYSR